MRTLTAILTNMHMASGSGPAPDALLMETCRVLASYADPDRAGTYHVATLVEEIVEAYEARQYTRKMEAQGLIVEHGEEGRE